jgi:hypothetical protein
MTITIEIGMGEAFDRLSILKIKSTHIEDIEKLKNVVKEYEILFNLMVYHMIKKEVLDLYLKLIDINQTLWNVENFIRLCEREGKFDEEFIEAARAIYMHNDTRAKLKKELNQFFGSKFVEEKSYTDYNT